MKVSASGNRLAIGLLLCGTIWLALSVSGVLRVSPVQFPAWVAFLVASGIVAGPTILISARARHWSIHFVAAFVFLACLFVFPWFYDQNPLFYWLTIVFVYLEIFWLIPLYKRGRVTVRRDARTIDP